MTQTQAPCHDYLLAQGFQWDADASTLQIETADELGMHAGGAFQPQGCYRRGEVSVTCERNTDTREENGMETTTTYPAVAVVAGPFGRAAAPAADFDLIGPLAAEFATGRPL